VHDLNQGSANVESGNDKRTVEIGERLAKGFSTMFLQEHSSSLHFETRNVDRAAEMFLQEHFH
jgi:hypothetical protein